MKPFEDTLREAGYSVTSARRRVFKAMQNQGPLTMHEVIERSKGVDRASVYRTIDLFEEVGIVEQRLSHFIILLVSCLSCFSW